MPNKDRLLVLLRTLQEKSDDETSLTTADIRKAIQDENLECSVRTLRRDVKSLKACGYDIFVQEHDGAYTEYSYLGRPLSKPETQILVDAVSAAQFIPQSQSKKLIAKLARMAGPSHEQNLKPEILVSEHVKAKNRKMIYTVQAIRRAIERERKITFRYLQYNTDKQQTLRHDGKKYIISPYATIWKNDRYYLVGFSEKHGCVANFRIDRMEVPEIIGEPRRPAPEDLKLEDNSDKIFWMFDGPEAEITLRFRPKLMNQVVDRFGTELKLKNISEESIDVTVTIHLSPTFYAWLFQYAGEMTIVEPEGIREAYAERLQTAIDDVLGE